MSIQESPSKRNPKTPGAHSPGPRVLLVDDLEESREMVREFLGSEGIEVIGEAANGREAVEAALELEPDVVVMDLRMPDMDGLEASRRIRECRPDTQVVMLSFYDEPALQDAARRHGVYEFLVKGESFLRLPEVILDAWEHGPPGSAGSGGKDSEPGNPV